MLHTYLHGLQQGLYAYTDIMIMCTHNTINRQMQTHAVHGMLASFFFVARLFLVINKPVVGAPKLGLETDRKPRHVEERRCEIEHDYDSLQTLDG